MALQEILRQVEDLKATATRLTEGAATVRVGATAYAPSDFVAQVQAAVTDLPVPTEFSVPGSAAEVTAEPGGTATPCLARISLAWNS